MSKIFKYIFEFKWIVLGIIALLIVQAYCDLSLPQYTSKLVNVGIQQGGIEHVAPDKMREATLEGLSLFLAKEEEQTLKDSYVLEDDSATGEEAIYKLNTSNKEKIEELDRILGMPMLALLQIQESGTMDLATLKTMLESGAATKDQMLLQMQEAKDKMGDSSEAIIQQRAFAFVQAEYEALGIDLGQYQNHYILMAGAKMLGMTVIMVLVAILAGYFSSYVAASIGRNLRSRVFKKVVSFSHSEMDQFSTASLITRSTNDIQQVQMVSVMLLRMVIYAPILGIGGVIKVVGTRTGMGWIIALAVGIIVLLVVVLMMVAMPKFKKMQILVDKLNLVAREILTGILVIRAFSREKHEEKRFEGANKDLMSTQLFTNRVMTFMMPVMMLIMNGISVLIVWAGAHGIDAGNLQVGDMMAFITYSMQIIMSFLMLTMMSVMLPRAGVAANRIDEVIVTKASIIDKDKGQTMDEAKADWNGLLSFKDVSFRYPGADEDALEHISFTAEPGKTTAIIGSTGCGKSTLIHLIPRFYDVTKGEITMDGVDIRDLSQHKLRSLLGFVPQKGVLFSGDIASNIKFGGEISDDAMKEAAEISQSINFIEEKQEGFESAISQGGTNVSGGQKQRLSIARAIAKKPKVLLFDDSFSALDYKTDIVLRQALKEKIVDATILIVAQRISTILHADQIIVLEEGGIAGIGTHEELLQSCEAYMEIARSQLSEAELRGGR
ncbi:ABC transporter ATP-binding protein/permease [Lachnospiraceae bacterium ZAX-1]